MFRIVAEILGFLGNRIDLNKERGDGLPLLFTAAQTGNSVLAQLLIEKGASPNCTMQSCATPLFTAVQHGHVDLVSVLIDSGADPQIPRVDGQTPFHMAIEKGDLTVILAIMKKADVNQARRDYETPLVTAAKVHWIINIFICRFAFLKVSIKGF